MPIPLLHRKTYSEAMCHYTWKSGYGLPELGDTIRESLEDLSALLREIKLCGPKHKVTTTNTCLTKSRIHVLCTDCFSLQTEYSGNNFSRTEPQIKRNIVAPESSSPDIEECFSQDADGDNLLMLAIIHQREDIARIIIKASPSHKHLDIHNKFGQSALHLAVLTGDDSTIRLLLSWGANPCIYDLKGNTPLHLACIKNDIKCVIALTMPLTVDDISDRRYQVPYQRMPQNIELRNYDGFTCLHLAGMNRSYKLMDYLINDLYADINAQEGKSGNTLLHFAAVNNDLLLLNFILRKHGLNVYISRYDGMTASDIAKMNYHTKMYELLQRFGTFQQVDHVYKFDSNCIMAQLGSGPKELKANDYDDIRIHCVLME